MIKISNFFKKPTDPLCKPNIIIRKKDSMQKMTHFLKPISEKSSQSMQLLNAHYTNECTPQIQVSHPIDMKSKTPDNVVYCDGSTFNNGKRHACGGIGVFFGSDDSRNVSEPFVDGVPTNQKTEIYALYRTLEIINSSDPQKYVVHTDSEYVINCITKWIPQWKRKNWTKQDGKQVKNVKLLNELYDLYIKLKNNIKIVHVKSQDNLADPLAVNGSRNHPNWKGGGRTMYDKVDESRMRT